LLSNPDFITVICKCSRPFRRSWCARLARKIEELLYSVISVWENALRP
jgi:hypothetical protein